MRLILLLKIFFFVNASGGATCPSACKCGIHKNFNTVDCSFEKLVMVETEVPSETQVLDLSHNNIIEIRDREFCVAELSMLQTLNISYNRIGQIHMNGFNCLHDLKILDLSQNIIQYVLPHWFWDLLALEELYLKHNELYSFQPDGSFIESNTLEILDISYCKLPHLSNDAFKRLPNLKILDISGNFLYQLNTDIIEPLKHLEVLAATNNTWTCNGVMKKLAKYCETRGIKYTDGCLTNPVHKFERIISKTKSIKNMKNGSFKLHTNNSQQNCTIANPKPEHFLSMKLLKPHYILIAVVSFATGMISGLVLGCWMRSSAKPRQSYRRIKRGRSLIENCDSLGNSTPVMYRKMEVNRYNNAVKI